MDFWTSSLVIAGREFPRFLGGPLDGITDSPFRQLVRQYSKQELLFTEMRHVRCIAHEKGAAKALAFSPLERPLNFQVAANSLEGIEAACARILAVGVDMVDLNIGCPARAVIRSGGGSALMADLPLLKQIFTCFRNALPIPFTVKMRAGFKTQNAVDVALLAQDCGVDAISVHPRLQTQMFTGRPDYALVARVKQAVSIPVLLSGGVVNWRTAHMAYEQTGADGFLIGRGIWGRPWKLQELAEHARGKSYEITHRERLLCALAHLRLMVHDYGQHGLYMYRKHLPFYVSGGTGASLLRQQLVQATDVQVVEDGLRSFLGDESA